MERKFPSKLVWLPSSNQALSLLSMRAALFPPDLIGLQKYLSVKFYKSKKRLCQLFTHKSLQSYSLPAIGMQSMSLAKARHARTSQT